MYNFTMFQAIAWMNNKKNMIKDCTVYGAGQSKMAPGMIQYMKNQMPNVGLANTPKQMFINLGAKSYNDGKQWEKMNRKYDLVVSADSFNAELDTWGHFKFLWERTRTGGYIVIDAAASVSSDPCSFSPNWVTYIRRYNNVDVPYLRISDKTGQYCVSADSEIMYTTRRLNEEILYKFKETQQLRLSVVIKKNESEELKTNGD